MSDEHYLPTLLAVHGLDAQTDCTGVLTHSDWTWPNWSPKKYSHLEVTAELVHKYALAQSVPSAGHELSSASRGGAQGGSGRRPVHLHDHGGLALPAVPVHRGSAGEWLKMSPNGLA